LSKKEVKWPTAIKHANPRPPQPSSNVLREAIDIAQLSPQLSSNQGSLGNNNQAISSQQLQLSEAALETLLADHSVTVEVDGQNIELIIDDKGVVQLRQVEPVLQGNNSAAGLLEAHHHHLGGVNLAGAAGYGMGMGVGTALTSIENTIVTPAQKTPISSVLSPPPDAHPGGGGASSSSGGGHLHSHHHHVTKNRPIAMKMPQQSSMTSGVRDLFGPGRPDLSPEVSPVCFA
jgi:hypothetical protein